MKRKLTIAAGIIHRLKILYLDEPTTGIDVASARQIRQLISEMYWGGTTLFLTTHYIEEAERLCDENGKKRSSGMKQWTAFWNIMLKDMCGYYLKPPNISWRLIFLCGLFFPVLSLPLVLQPLSFALPLTYGVDILHGAIHGQHILPLWLDFLIFATFGFALFSISLKNIHRKWIL
ncbi:MAG: hypothetical protein ACOC59_03905 [Bacteroidota bacterium]